MMTVGLTTDLLLAGFICLVFVTETELATSVAFSVGKTSHQSMAGVGVVRFDKSFLNVGNGFNFPANAFICPRPGVYVFHLHAMSGVLYGFRLGIYHNDKLKVATYNGLEHYGSGSNTVLLSLQVGDVVMVKFMYGQHELSGLASEVFTTFSGYLL